ncbi:MAG: hypothetical protein Q4F84_01320, partial [Fibrobacter sp.]|nr:hypothetical protein [Fibrobacter sp.]
FVAVGGIEINEDFLKKLTPCDGVRVLLKHENDYSGMDDIRSVSEIKDNRIIINDKEYLAVQIEISCIGDGESPKLIIILEK